MNPIVIGLGLFGAGFGIYKAAKKPAAQVQSLVSPTGVPVKVITPITNSITPNQKSGVPHPPAPTPVHVAVPHAVPSVGVVYAPPKAIVVTPQGVQPAPIIQTPTGSSSVAIVSLKDVQHALNTLGFAPSLKEDGILGPKTIANVKAFQSKNGLTVDGNAGPNTKAALSNALIGLASSSTAVRPQVQTPVTRAPLPYNDAWAAPKTAPNATEVANGTAMSLRDIQRNLNLLGASPKLAEDGVSGPRTVAAIKSFQMGHGLAADGIAGPATKAKLYQLAHAPAKQFSGQFSGSFS